jgi:hypothetical protein
MALFKVLYESMEILEVDTAACIIAALEVTDQLATRLRGGVEARLTSSSSRSIAESAFMREPRSDSTEEEIFPAPRRSVGLREREMNEKEEKEEKREAYSNGPRS